MQLWHKVVIGMAAGIAAGLTLDKEYLVYVQALGTIFINLIKMIIVPLIFLAIVSGITSIEDKTKLGRISKKSVGAYLTTAMFAVVIGLVSANLFHPGMGVDLKVTDESQVPSFLKDGNSHPASSSALQTFVNIIPTNAIGAMAEGNMLQVVFFAIFTGIALNIHGGGESKKIINGVHTLASLVFKMISLIVKFSPYGVFGLIAWVVGTQGTDIIISLAKLVVTVLVACLVQYIIFGILISVFGRISPFPFYKKAIDFQSLAFSTSSSKATLPTTMEVSHEKMGVSKQSTQFVLPLGASINMDGTAIYLGICSVFIAQATGVDLSMHQYLLIILTSTLASIGAAGIPSGSLFLMGMVLSTVGLPIEGIAVIAGVDRILDMIRTTINITGDAAITLIIDKSEGTLDLERYHSK